MKARGDVGFRWLCCLLLGLTGYALLSASTFSLRLRDDVPRLVPGLDESEGIALLLAGLLAGAPLLARDRFLHGFLVSSFVMSGIGAYWWTTVPWDELIIESNFSVRQRPDAWDFALVACPAILAAFYAVASRGSRLRADLLRRGAEADDAARAGAAAFLSGAAALFTAIAMGLSLLALLASGWLDRLAAPRPIGVPALLAVALLVVGGVALARARPRSGSASLGALAAGRRGADSRGVRRPS